MIHSLTAKERQADAETLLERYRKGKEKMAPNHPISPSHNIQTEGDLVPPHDACGSLPEGPRLLTLGDVQANAAATNTTMTEPRPKESVNNAEQNLQQELMTARNESEKCNQKVSLGIQHKHTRIHGIRFHF